MDVFCLTDTPQRPDLLPSVRTELDRSRLASWLSKMNRKSNEVLLRYSKALANALDIYGVWIWNKFLQLNMLCFVIFVLLTVDVLKKNKLTLLILSTKSDQTKPCCVLLSIGVSTLQVPLSWLYLASFDIRLPTLFFSPPYLRPILLFPSFKYSHISLR